jgi:photosystem II stability/assembly factor-like uncharacterized protein
MKRYKFLSILLLNILGTGILHSQWRAENCPTSNNLNAITLINGSSGWIVGDKGTILKKSGEEWIDFKTPTTENLFSVHMLSNNDGWAVGAKGTIIHFNGIKWDLYESPTRNNLYSVSFIDSENGIAVGFNGVVLTYNAGIWKLAESEIRGNLFTTASLDDAVWIAGGLEYDNVPIMKMEYGDAKSLVRSHNPYATIYSVDILSPYNIWAVGDPSTILHFNGFQWEKSKVNGSFSSLKSVYFSDEDNGISVGFGGSILAFAEGKWEKEFSSVTANLNSIAVAENVSYVVGDKGTIISKGQIPRDQTNGPLKITSETEIYPNPCDKTLNIALKSEIENSFAMISVMNTNGNIFIQKRVSIGSGSSTFPLATSDLENGLYILKTVVGTRVTANKFIIKH